MSALRDLYEVEAIADLLKQESEAKRIALHADENALPIKRKAARRKGAEVSRDVGVLLERADCEAENLLQLHGETDAVAHVAEWIKRRSLHALCEGMGVDYPESRYGHHCEVARLQSGDWWGRKLRVADWRQFEMRKIRTATVGIHATYCSDEIATAHQWHRAAIAQMLDNMYAVRLDGAALLTLHEAALKSKSNPAIRRVAMIRQAKGMAELSTTRPGWSWAFFTVTAPSRFHRTASAGRRENLRRFPNPKWDGSSPRDAQQHLCTVFSRWRAKLAREGIDYMYCRVVEPHVDGCPHWHGIVWAHQDDLPKIRQHLRGYALQVDGKEPGAWKHRMRWRKYRPWAARKVEGETDQAREVNAAIGYLIAYIGKNIDGRKADDSSMGYTTDRAGNTLPGDAVDNACRVVAWASLWGIRQFDFGGAPAIGPYDELRRLRAAPGNMLAPAWEAADRGDFAAYAQEAEQLGLDLIVKTSRDRLQEIADDIGVDMAPSEELADAALASDVFNRWGEPTRRWVLGVRDGDGIAEVNTRPHKWRTVAADGLQALAVTLGNAGRRLLDLMREKLQQQREQADAAALAVALAVRARGEAGRLGPGSITVRASGPGLQEGGGPPGRDEWDDWYQVGPYGIEQAVF